MTPKAFKKKAEALFFKKNPTATVEWVKTPKLVTFPTGVKEFYGTFAATAPGFKPKLMIATGDATYTMVR
jgi:hypothetical protein